MGILQARILEWVAMPSSRWSSWPEIEPASLTSPALQADSLPLSHLRSPNLPKATQQISGGEGPGPEHLLFLLGGNRNGWLIRSEKFRTYMTDRRLSWENSLPTVKCHVNVLQLRSDTKEPWKWVLLTKFCWRGIGAAQVIHQTRAPCQQLLKWYKVILIWHNHQNTTKKKSQLSTWVINHRKSQWAF